MIPSEQMERIVSLFDSHGGVVALWVFGSEASDAARPDSDVDLAVLFAEQPAPETYLDLVGELGALLGKDVDLVDLDRASPVLAMQVLRTGRILLDRNPARRVALESSLPGRYEDVMRMRREVEQHLIERVCDG